MALGVPPFYAGYLWSNGHTTSTDTFSTAGSYWIRVVSSAGCVAIDSFEIEVFPSPDFPEWGDTTACAGDTLVYDAGPGYSTYIWSTGEFTSSVVLTSFTDLWVQVTDTNNCVSRTDTSEVRFSPLPARPIIQQLDAGLHSSFSNDYQWVFEGQAIQGATLQDYFDPMIGNYSVIVTNAFGCSAESNVFEVLPDDPGNFISGGFSPNADGVNDVFHVEGLWRYPDNKLTVFNRWGEQVFQQSPYQNNWDGLNMNGKPLPDGNYFVVLEFGAERESYKGAVMISR